MKKVKKILVYGLLSGFLLVAGSLLGIWLGQDRIISLFVQEANRHLRTPVRVGQLEVSVLAAFPRVAITLHDVVVQGSLAQDTVPLARLHRLYCAFNAWDILAGRYRIRTLVLENGRLQVRQDARGEPNYAVFRPDTTPAADQPLAFNLEQVELREVAVVYDNLREQQHYAQHVQAMQAALAISARQIRIRAAGDFRIETIRLGADDYLQDKNLGLTTQLLIDRQARMLTIEPSELRLGRATYALAGRLGYGVAAPALQLSLEGRNTDLQAITALLPPRLAQRLSRYRSRGEVYFRGEVQRGEGEKRARLDVRFGCRNASLYHPDYQESVQQVFLTGRFTNGARRTAQTSLLTLQKLRGTLRGRPFSGSLRYENLLDPQVRLDLRADLDVAHVLRFFPVAAVRSASGQAQLAVQFAGSLRQFRAHPATAAVQTAGELTMRRVSVQLRDYRLPLTALSGNFLLRRNDIAITNFTGRFGHSDFRLNGFFKNALGWLLLPHQQLLVEADAEARLLDLDQLLTASVAPAAGPATRQAGAAGYALEVSPNLALDLNASVQQLRFRRLRARELRGTVRLRQQQLSTPGLSVAAAGGHATLSGQLDARRPELLRASTTMNCQQLPLDSLFYVFENFGQSFITARHLRGTLTASVESDLYFDRHLTPLTDRLEAEIKATVRNGELNDFEPLQKLSMVASREQLRHLRFAELTNNFYIQSRTVYLPEMEIRSNVRTASVLRVTGTHTFDQQMDYHLSIPLLPGLLHRASFGGESLTGPALLLAVQGREDNFRVSLDRSRPSRRATAGSAPPEAGPTPSDAAGRVAPGSPEPAAPKKLFEVKKPAPKPAQPQPDQYFDF